MSLFPYTNFDKNYIFIENIEKSITIKHFSCIYDVNVSSFNILTSLESITVSYDCFMSHLNGDLIEGVTNTILQFIQVDDC